jgi:very-long-chain (3R)-3-hydroxyacyl-CoA dehydratase
MGLGNWVKVTQTLAVLDVVHAALGLVKSNVGTAASQVFSRLWAVWAVVEMVPEVGLLVRFPFVEWCHGENIS